MFRLSPHFASWRALDFRNNRRVYWLINARKRQMEGERENKSAVRKESGAHSALIPFIIKIVIRKTFKVKQNDIVSR